MTVLILHGQEIYIPWIDLRKALASELCTGYIVAGGSLAPKQSEEMMLMDSFQQRCGYKEIVTGEFLLAEGVKRSC